MNNKAMRAACFDLDDTIFDHNTAMRASLRKVAETHSISQELFLSAFMHANLMMWHLYEQGQIDRDTIRFGRMKTALMECNRGELNARMITDEYFSFYNQHNELITGAKESLIKLSGIIKLGIITNGFADIQRGKLERTGISDLFSLVIVSEEMGVLKPQPQIFRIAQERLEIESSRAVFIGDSYKTDILGALAAGWNAIWFNPAGQITNEITPCKMANSWHGLEEIITQYALGGFSD